MPFPFRPFGQKVFGAPPGLGSARVRSGSFVVAVGLVALLDRLESALTFLDHETRAESSGRKGLVLRYRPPLWRTVCWTLQPNMGLVGGQGGSCL